VGIIPQQKHKFILLWYNCFLSATKIYFKKGKNMKIKSYEELQELNSKIKSVEKKLASKRKALISAQKKVDKLEEDIMLLEDELKSFFGEENLS
jgi:predicted  nucleic acid-binding Zn-ribbon protein